MGPGCVSVSRTSTADSELCVGVWADGRIGTYRGTRSGTSYGGRIFGADGEEHPMGGLPPGDPPGNGNLPLLQEIVHFFRQSCCCDSTDDQPPAAAVTPPVSAAETLEIYAFMEASELSLSRG